jgi:hypothetical protein
MKRAEPPGLDRGSAFPADPVQTAAKPLQRLFDRSELVQSGIVDRLQGLVVLQLDRPIAPVAGQRFATALQVEFHSLMALDQGTLPS